MSTEILSLPTAPQAVLDSYQQLEIHNLTVACPYFINSKGTRDLRVMVGKGTPTEIITETKVWLQLKGIDVENLEPSQLREFMRQRKIGIDCSGILYHTLDAWTKVSGMGPLKRHVKFPSMGILSRLKIWLRPAENIGADLLTGKLNAQPIPLSAIQPGDLIRSKSIVQGADHVLIITRVGLVNGKPQWAEYMHSTYHFGDENGVRVGKIEIADLEKPLADQNWLEVDAKGNSPTLDGFRQRIEDNGLRRLNFFDQLVH